MLLSNVPTHWTWTAGNKHQSTQPLIIPPLPYFPYLNSPASSPLPDTLLNQSGPAYWPQIATTSTGAGQSVYQLVYAVNFSGVGSVLEIADGMYNATLAQTIFTTHNCQSPCTRHVPIAWQAPTPIAVFGSAMIQADATSSDMSCIAVAATVAGSTSVFVSYEYGAPGSWYSLTGNKPIAGGTPHLLTTLGAVYLTTLSPTLRVASLSYPQNYGCWLAAVPPSNTPPRGVPFGAPPVVVGVVPFQATVGTQVLINGTGLAGPSQVKFGSVVAPTFSYHAPSITATVPAGAGQVPVTVLVSGQWSAPTCGSNFQYGATLATGTPQVFSLSPAGAAPNATVTVNGAYFTPTSKVYFGPTLATTNYVQPGVLSATVPSGNGTVNLTVKNGALTSPKYCGDIFSFKPIVSGLLPSRDVAGNTIQIIGSFFNSSSTVKFGAWSSNKVTYVASNQLYAKVPTGNGSVHVTVITGSASSATSCSDLFSYGPAPASGAPSVTSVSPKAASSGAIVTVNGANFTTGTTVLFGGIPATTYSMPSTTQIQARAPLGSGSVHVQVQNSADLSVSSCNDVFTITFPAAQHQTVATLGNTYGDSLLMLLGNVTVVAGNVTNTSIVIYHQKPATWLFTTQTVTPFSASNGSAIFNSVGGTSLAPPDPAPGQVAIAGNATNLFMLYTTNLGGRTVGMTVASSNGGKTWQGPYSAGDTYGSVQQPQVVLSPAGYFFVGWVSGRGASWSVQEAIYASSGNVLIGPTVLPGSNSSAGLANASFGLGSDAFARPVAAWDTLNSSGVGSIAYTAAYDTPSTELKLLRAGFNDTNATDYQNLGPAGISVFQGRVHRALANLSVNLTATSFCNSQKDAAVQVYENVTTLDTAPLLYGPAIPSCNFAVLYDNSFLAPPSGPTSANLYLQVETQILLEGLGYGEFGAPTWLSWPSPGKSGPYQLDSGGTGFGTWGGNEVTISPQTLNPNALWLNTTYSFAHNSSTSQYWVGHPGRYGHYTYCGSNTTAFGPVAFYSNVTVTPAHWSGVSQSFQSNSILPSPYVTNLTPLRNGTWQVIETALFQSTARSVNVCPATMGFKNWSGTYPPFTPIKKSIITISGTYTTGLDPSPYPPVINSSAANLTTSNDTIPWNNTVYAHANAWLNFSGKVIAWSDSINRASEFVSGSGFQNVTDGPPYAFQMMLRTANGGWNGSWWPVLNDNNVSIGAPFETSTYACQMVQLANPLKLWWQPNDNVTNLTSSAVTITWYSVGSGRGWVSAQDAAGGSLVQLAKDFPLPGSTNGTYKYIAELHGLQPWGTYNLLLHEQNLQGGTGNTCKVMYSSTSNVLHVQMPAVFAPAEADNPYDSISHSGGGAEIYWQVPYNFTRYASFVSGSLYYWNSTVTSIYPITNLTQVASSQFPGAGSSVNTTYAINLTGLSPNTAYSILFYLNFSVPQPGGLHVIVLATSSPYSFTYLLSTSGDGLTDAEKTRGWYVTTTSAGGTTSVRKVTASIGSYSTNGLVNDLVEKQFALDPRSLDSAGARMLDTWNLTFDLGTNSGSAPACPAAFHCWYQNSTNPFASPPYPRVSPCATVHLNTTGPQTTVDDSSAYDACVLWQGSNTLPYIQSKVQNESTGWVRATIGKLPSNIASGDWVLTVWGKLSWGADPLSASTAHDGIPDGYRVSPLGETDVNVTITGWQAGSLNPGNGVAAFIYAVSNPAPYFSSLQVDYSAYTLQVVVPSGSTNANYGGTFTVTFPVYATEQYATLNFSLIQNTGTGGTNTYGTAVSGGPINVDLTNPARQTQTFPGGSDSLSVAWQAIGIYPKAPTAIIVPGDNSTLAPLPLGLQRYVGEQNFVLLEANLNASAVGSSTLSQSGIPWEDPAAANGIAGSYTFSVSSGITNILVPRVLFMHSPLGQALLNGTSTSTSIASLSYNSFIQGSWSSSTWTARALGDTTHGTDYGVGKYHYLKIFSNSDQNCSSGGPCGGISSSPSAESHTPALAVQGMFVFNLTSLVDLQGLLAGLLLNSSGNFTNSIFTATQFLPSLGLGSTVLSALANSSQLNAGAYGPPNSTAPAPKQWWQVLASVIWNAVSGVIGALSVVWSALVAAASFVADLVAKVAAWGVAAANQIVSGLKAIASAIAWAFEQLLAYLISLAKAALSPITQAVSNLIGAFVKTLWSDIQPLWNSFNNTQALSSTQAMALFDDLLGTPFLIALGMATALVIVLTILSVISVGEGFVANLVFQLITTAIVSVLTWGMDSLVPPGLLSKQAMSSVWWLYNATGGGAHTMLVAASGPNCPQLLNVGLAVFGAALSGYAVAGDLKTGPKLFLKDTKDLLAGKPWLQAEGPVIGLALDIVSLVLGLIGVLAAWQGNWIGFYLGIIGIILGFGGLILGFYQLAHKVKGLDQLPGFSGFYQNMKVGMILGGIGIGAGFATILLGC